jgi:hypothetical protein
MKTLNLHTNNQMPTQECAWTGLGMFSISKPVNGNILDYRNVQVRDVETELI